MKYKKLFLNTNLIMSKVFICYNKREYNKNSYRVLVVESISKVIVTGCCTEEAEKRYASRQS